MPPPRLDLRFPLPALQSGPVKVIKGGILKDSEDTWQVPTERPLKGYEMEAIKRPVGGLAE